MIIERASETNCLSEKKELDISAIVSLLIKKNQKKTVREGEAIGKEQISRGRSAVLVSLLSGRRSYFPNSARICLTGTVVAGLWRSIRGLCSAVTP